jgi:negative regulator of flagellin synthesis FlgM
MTKLKTGLSSHPSKPHKQQQTQQPTDKPDQESVAKKPNNTSARLEEIESRLTDKLPIDPQRINQMKNAIANGEYRVDAERIANKMIDFESSLKK